MNKIISIFLSVNFIIQFAIASNSSINENLSVISKSISNVKSEIKFGNDENFDFIIESYIVPRDGKLKIGGISSGNKIYSIDGKTEIYLVSEKNILLCNFSYLEKRIHWIK